MSWSNFHSVWSLNILDAQSAWMFWLPGRCAADSQMPLSIHQSHISCVKSLQCKEWLPPLHVVNISYCGSVIWEYLNMCISCLFYKILSMLRRQPVVLIYINVLQLFLVRPCTASNQDVRHLILTPQLEKPHEWVYSFTPLEVYSSRPWNDHWSVKIPILLSECLNFIIFQLPIIKRS